MRRTVQAHGVNKFRSMIATAFFLYATVTCADEKAAPIKVACVGDSITYGAGIEDRDKNSYPAQLAVALGPKWSVENFGVNGATLLKKGDTPYWNLDQYKAALKSKPDVVIIMLGTNDSKPGNWKYKTEYVPNYVELIESFQNLESKPTVWIAYPVPAYSGEWGITASIINEEIIPRIDEVSNKTKVRIIDLHSEMIGREESYFDKIHPNVAGAKLMAERIAAAITSGVQEANHDNRSPQ